MNLRSKRDKRRRNLGFSLLETMIAFAVLSMVLVAVFNVSSRLLGQQSDAKIDYENAAMAKFLLDEYVVTFPDFPASGTYKGKWHWRILETEEQVQQKTEFDHYFDFVRVTTEVTNNIDNKEPYRLFTVIARRAANP